MAAKITFKYDSGILGAYEKIYNEGPKTYTNFTDYVKATWRYLKPKPQFILFNMHTSAFRPFESYEELMDYPIPILPIYSVSIDDSLNIFKFDLHISPLTRNDFYHCRSEYSGRCVMIENYN